MLSRNASRTLYYTIHQLYFANAPEVHAAVFAVSGFVPRAVLNNARIESFAVNFRSLTDFLWVPGSRDDDLWAGDYFAADSDWMALRSAPDMPAALKLVREKVHKTTAHITTARLHYKLGDKDKPREWEMGDCIALLESDLRAFIAGAPVGSLGVLADFLLVQGLTHLLPSGGVGRCHREAHERIALVEGKDLATENAPTIAKLMAPRNEDYF